MKLKIYLNEIGIDYIGSLCDSNFFADVYSKIHHSHNENKWIDNSGVCLFFEEFVNRGGYGALALCRRISCADGRQELVFAKIPARPFLPRDCLFWEACIQIIVRNTLARAGFKNGAPRVRDIFELSDGTIGYTMDMLVGSAPFNVILRDSDQNKFVNLIVDSIFQVASMISILQKELGFNHRDLRSTNLLCREIKSDLPKKIVVWEEKRGDAEPGTGTNKKVKQFEFEIHSDYEFTLIDFGFTCFGTCKNCAGFRLNGHVYNLNDPCPKPGRDMFMFLAFLFAEFSDKMDSGLRKYFKKWLHPSCGIDLPLRIAKPDRGIYQFLQKYGMNGDKWIYYICGNTNLSEIATTNAIKVVANLQEIKEK